MIDRKLLYLVTLILSLSLSYSVFLLFDNQTIGLLAKEDGFFQSIGAICFLIASILFFVKFLKNKSGNDFIVFKTKKTFSFCYWPLCFFWDFGKKLAGGRGF